VLQSQANRGKLLTVKNGFLICPRCRRNKQLYKIHPGDEAKQVTVYCRDCKREIPIMIDQGQCFESRSQ